MTRNIGILIEMENGTVKESNLGMITLAAGQGAVTALAPKGLDDTAVKTIGEYGVNTIAELDLSEDPAIQARFIEAAANQLNLQVLFGLSGAEGKDLLPRVAALLDAPLVMDCLDVDLETGQCKTSQYSGKLLATIRVTGDVQVYGIRPNAIPAVASPNTPEKVSPEIQADAPANLKLVSSENGTSDDGQVSLAEADIIIGGGRGMKNGENFSLLFGCAKKMKAAVGASRVAVDEGWIPYAHQVGQTGEKVSPSVYIACGISGSIQHFAGMKTAKMIIAVNKDENAAMVAHSDYYVLGDLFDILPELEKQL